VPSHALAKRRNPNALALKLNREIPRENEGKMRARNIKPGFFKNEDLADCDLPARLLFIGLWCMADRAGRLEYRSKRIKAELFPYDNCNIDKLLKQLSDKKFIQIYSVSNEKYIEILNFSKHQNCHIKEAPSTIPTPDKHHTSIEVATLNPESLLLNPESPIPPAVEPKQQEPVDNSQDEKTAFIKELNSLKSQIFEKYPQFKFDLFIQNNIRRKNHKAIIHTLKTLTSDTVIENPMAWCETILKKESMNYNAADSENQSNEYKKHDLTGFGAILNKIQTQGA